MKYLLMFCLLMLFVSCEDEPTDGDDTSTTNYRCEEMSEANEVSGFKIGDWWNFDLERCNSTEAKCQR